MAIRTPIVAESGTTAVTQVRPTCGPVLSVAVHNACVILTSGSAYIVSTRACSCVHAVP